MKNEDRVFEFLHYLRVFAPAPYRNPRSKAHPDGEFKPIPGRRFSLDAAWPSVKVAVEIDGGNWIARRVNGRCVCVGRHTQAADYEKLNLLVLAGWRVLRFTPAMLKKDPEQCVARVVILLEQIHQYF